MDWKQRRKDISDFHEEWANAVLEKEKDCHWE